MERKRGTRGCRGRVGWMHRGAVIFLLAWVVPLTSSSSVAAQDCVGDDCAGDSSQGDPPISEADPPAASDGNPDLRMAKRLHVILRLGAGGKIEQFNGIDRVYDTKPTAGLTLRFEAPVHDVLTTGVLLSVYSFGADGDAFTRGVGMDISPFLKGRYAFAMGKKGIEGEAYAIFQFGLSLAHAPDNENLGLTTFGAGFNTAIAPGFMVWPHERIGTFFEVGYSYGWARFEGVLTGTLGQAVIRLGAAFAFY